MIESVNSPESVPTKKEVNELIQARQRAGRSALRKQGSTHP